MRTSHESMQLPRDRWREEQAEVWTFGLHNELKMVQSMGITSNVGSICFEAFTDSLYSLLVSEIISKPSTDLKLISRLLRKHSNFLSWLQSHWTPLAR